MLILQMNANALEFSKMIMLTTHALGEAEVNILSKCLSVESVVLIVIYYAGK